MASWKKVIVSGSNAELNQISASTLTVNDIIVTGSGTITADNFVIGANGSAIPISSGGTGATSFTAHQIVLANAAGDGLTTISSGSIKFNELSGVHSYGSGLVSASSNANARTHLGLGDMAVINQSAVSITGGTISTPGTALFSGSNALANNQFTGSFSGSFVGNGAGLTGVSTVADMDDLTDMTIASLSNGQILVASASKMSNLSLSAGDITLAVANGASTGTVSFNIADDRIGNSELKQDDNITLQALATTNNLDVGANLDVTGTSTFDLAITASKGAKISGVERVGSGGRNVGLFVENDVSASGFSANFFEITSSVIITSASTEFGNAISDTHVFSGSIALTSSANVVLDAPIVIGGVGTTFSASIVDGLTGNFDSVDIDGGAIDGVTLGTNSAVTQLVVDNVNINGTTIGHTADTDLIALTNGKVTFTGETEIPNADINGGNIDGTIIGATNGLTTTQVTGSITGSFTGDGSGITGIVSTLSLAGDSGTDTVDLKTGTLTFDGDSATGLSTKVIADKVEISQSIATTSAVGVAKFNSVNFGVTAAGAVTIKNGGVVNAELVNSEFLIQGDSTEDSASLGETIKFAGTANEITTAVSSNVVTFALPDDVTIGDALTVTGLATIGGGYGSTGTTLYGNGDISANGNVVIDGTLTVVGATTTIQSQDLTIEDNIIWLGSGSYSNSNAVDSGIVFERGNASTPNQYAAFFFDETSNRFAVAPTSGSGLTDDGLSGATSLASLADSQFIMTVSSSATAPSSAPAESTNGSEFGDASTTATQVGQVRVQSADEGNGVDGDIWIYS